MKWYDKISFRSYAAAGIGVIIFTALILLAMGRIPWCKCGYVELWHGTANDSGDSQHISDWYTFSHIIHGFLFYFFLWLVARKLPVGARLLLAVILEAAWEIFENTNFSINRYRTATIALNYYGDSVLNSVSDIIFCVFGFFLARRLPVWLSVALIVAMELIVGYIIRDNLILNIVMFLHSFESIKQWQMGVI